MNMLRHRNRNGLSCRNEFLFPVETHFNKIFDQFFQNDLKGIKDSIKASQGYPKMDVLEDNGSLLVKVAVPGMKLENLTVEVEGGDSSLRQPYKTVTISGRMAEEHEAGENATYHVRELRHSQFKRILQLPDDVEGDPIAELKDGILTLEWKMKEAEPPPSKKLIEIKEG